jgi:hypothetical protein
MARIISIRVPDPAGLAAVDLTNPQTWNRYAYVGNNPLSNVDPQGLDDSTTSCDASNHCTNVTNVDVTAIVPGWFYLAWIGWPGQGSITSFYCGLMGGCPGGGGSSSGGGGGGGQPQPQPKPQPKPPILNQVLGMRAPGQTFNNCMQANAGSYSLLGVADFALNADGQIANNFWLGFTPASNVVSNTYNALTGSLTSLVQAGPTIVGIGMGTTVTYGRRTSSIMSLNLPGTPGGPKGGFPALGSPSSNAAQVGKAAAGALKLAIDAGFFLAEGVGCLIPAN